MRTEKSSMISNEEIKNAWLVMVKDDYTGCDIVKGEIGFVLGMDMFICNISGDNLVYFALSPFIFVKKKYAKKLKSLIEDYLNSSDAEDLLDGDVIASEDDVWGDNELLMDLDEYIDTLSSLKSVDMHYEIDCDGVVYEIDYAAVDKEIEKIAEDYRKKIGVE